MKEPGARTEPGGSEPTRRQPSWRFPLEWEWIPHLLVVYGIALVASTVLGLVLLFLAGDPGGNPDALAAELGRTEWSFATKSLGALVLLCPLGALYATVRVILNELRWRRTGDPRGR